MCSNGKVYKCFETHIIGMSKEPSGNTSLLITVTNGRKELKERIRRCRRIHLKNAPFDQWGWGKMVSMRDGFVLLWFPDVKIHLSFLKNQ